jgi:hypothetical protein
MYVVNRQGVYQQGILGVFDDIEKAKLCVLEGFSKERDDYHDFYIRKFELNEMFENYGEYEEGNKNVIFIASRKNGKIRIETPEELEQRLERSRELWKKEVEEWKKFEEEKNEIRIQKSIEYWKNVEEK